MTPGSFEGPTRRRVVQAIGAAGLLSPALAAAAPQLSSPAAAAAELALVDHRLPGAAEFAAHFAARGAPVAAVDGDVTDLWLGRLDPLWRSRPATVAGLTDAHSLYFLEHLAWGAGLRTSHLGEVGEHGIAWLIAPTRIRQDRNA